MKKGLLLINLGTPEAPKVSSVRSYLAEFLIDRRVIELNGLLRYVLVYGLILPLRPRKTTEAYRSIWTAEGSPLLILSQQLTKKVHDAVKDTHTVVLGMRYGEPSLQHALAQLKDHDEITIIPLYPQYASSSSGSAIEAVLTIMRSWKILPTLHIIRDFYQNSGFIAAAAALIKPYIQTHDFILFSYHGIPENHLLNITCDSICEAPCPVPTGKQSGCYRAQCMQTTRLIANELNLKSNFYTTAFQSRLGRTPWIKPYTDKMLITLAASGINRIAIVCPSFVVDCLETLEEIGIRAQETWLALGGEALTLIPCVNDSQLFINGMVEQYLLN